MPKLTLRHGVWTAVGLLAIAVISVSAYLLTYKHPAPPQPLPDADSFEMVLEEQHAKALPEYAELRRLNAKENRPLTAAAIARVGELTHHTNWWVRLSAITALGNAPEPLRGDAIALVTPHLKDEKLLVRASAMDTLARLDAKGQIPTLVAFANSADSDERACARRALKQLGHPVE